MNNINERQKNLIFNNLNFYEDKTSKNTSNKNSFFPLIIRSFLSDSKNVRFPSKKSYFLFLNSQKKIFQSYLSERQKEITDIINLEQNKESYIVGIISRTQTISQKFLNENNLAYMMGKEKFVEDKEKNIEEDSIFFEDPTGRIKLMFGFNVKWGSIYSYPLLQPFKKNFLINGFIVLLVGEFLENNDFFVKKVIFNCIKNSDYNNSNSYIQNKVPILERKFILILSNIEIFKIEKEPWMIKFENFLESSVLSNNIEKIIFSGNFIKEFFDLKLTLQSSIKDFKLFSKTKENLINSFSYLEKFINKILLYCEKNKITLDIMKTTLDTEKTSTPLKDDNFGIFNQIYSKNINIVANPYYIEYKNNIILVMSNENLEELKKFNEFENESDIQLLEKIVLWGNIYPKHDEFGEFNEIFNLKFNNQFPNIIIVTNCQEFDQKIIKEEIFVKIITVPSIKNKNSFAMIDFENLNCFEIFLEK